MRHTKLPVGMHDFQTIVSSGYTYVDKTKLIYKLITEGLPYFLSRPKGFGKSLFVSTLHALFSGKRDLFKGLWIDDSDWSWKQYPVIRLDMSTIENSTPEKLELDLIRALNDIASENHLTLRGYSSGSYLSDLLSQLSKKESVVVLIDNYDKPMLDHFENMEIAAANLKILRDFYIILKAEGRYLRFLLLTGVTKISLATAFSGLNHLNDITMSNRYSALLGFTLEELKYYFASEIQDVAAANDLSTDECDTKIKEWYNGYKFSESGESIYNPLSTLKLLQNKTFSTYWLETNTPSFLNILMKKKELNLMKFKDITVFRDSIGMFDLEDLPTLPLLYQSGYLTIKSKEEHFNAYCLSFPNLEVIQAVSKSLSIPEDII